MKIVARRQVTENSQPDTQIVNYQQPQTQSQPQYMNQQQNYVQPQPMPLQNNLVQNNPSKAPIPPIDNAPRRTGWNYEYLLDNGQIVNTEQAYDMAMQGLLENIQCSTNKGVKYIKSLPDGNPDNDLQDLPSF